MTVDYGSLINSSDKREILLGRIRQFAAEAYQYSLNLKTALALEATEQAEQIENSLKIIEAAIKIHQDELATIPDNVVYTGPEVLGDAIISETIENSENLLTPPE
jgi:hypothetical protein